ncbi:MAG TPA: ABC transporter substrate-binding protein [Beijerinckiaceae bacterium]|nr:ABC transporter substrate-binding protein [Beijerinckiaceae bacterium]
MSFVGKIKALALAAGLAAGLGAASAAEKVTVTHWGVLMYGAPYAVALDKGFYKEQGLDIDGVLTSKGGGTTMRNVMASSLPYGEVSLAAVVAAIQQGIDLKIVHTGARTAGEILWVTMPDSPIKTPKDLDGKKVAFTSPKSVTEMLLIMVSDKHGIKTDSVAAGGIGAGLTMLQQKAVVAAPIMDPIWARMHDKFRPVFWAKDELPPMVQTVGVTTTEFAKANPDTLRKLIAARRKGVEFVYSNPEESADILAKHYEIDRKVALTAINNMREIRYWGPGEFEYEGMDNMVRGLEIVGEIKGKVDWSKHVDESFLK